MIIASVWYYRYIALIFQEVICILCNEYECSFFFFTEMFDMKMKYDESDHVVIRATRTFTDKVSELFGG